MSKNNDDIPLHPEHGVNPTIPVCFICYQPRNEVALLGNNYKKKADRYMLIDEGLCEECQKHIDAENVFLIEVYDNSGYDGTGTSQHEVPRTGKYICVKKEAFERIYDDNSKHNSIVFIEQSALKQLVGDEYYEEHLLDKSEE